MLVAMRAPKQKVASQLDASLWILLGALIGARSGFVAANWGYFQAHWLEIPQVWLGGLSWPGAVVGGLLGLSGLALARRDGLGSLADEMFPLALLLTLAAWLAAWESGVAYGPPAAPNIWWAAPALDEWGAWALRWPLQPVGALAVLVIFWLVDRLCPRLHQPGEAASLALMGIALSLFGLSFLRADPGQTWRGWRLDSWSALVFVGLASVFCLAAFWPRRKKRNYETNPSTCTN
jgi:phosphatidylglycerol:prolipoprotein diacylglycerol transferase